MCALRGIKHEVERGNKAPASRRDASLKSAVDNARTFSNTFHRILKLASTDEYRLGGSVSVIYETLLELLSLENLDQHLITLLEIFSALFVDVLNLKSFQSLMLPSIFRGASFRLPFANALQD